MEMNNQISMKSWISLIAVSSVLMLINIDYTSVNIAISSIGRSLHGPLPQLQWVISGYSISWACFVVIGGKLSDLYSRKTVFTIGVVIFILTSFVSALSQGLWFLIISRILQGIGSGFLYAPAMAMAFTSFSESKRGLAIGVLSSLSAFGLAVGPTIGGFLLDFFGWRIIFIINIPIGLSIIIAVYATVNSDRVVAKKPVFDLLGTLCLLILVLCIMLGSHELVSNLVFTNLSVILLSVGMIFVVIFAFVENKAKLPLVNFQAIKNSNFICASITRFFLQFSFASLLFALTLFLNKISNYSTSKAGTIMLALTLIFGSLSPFVGKLTDYFGVKWPIIIGMSTFSLGLLGISFLGVKPDPWLIVFWLLVCSAGLAIAYPAVNTAALKSVSVEHTNTASSVLTMFALFGVTSGILVTTFTIILQGMKIFKGWLDANHINCNTTCLLQLKESLIHSKNHFLVSSDIFHSKINVLSMSAFLHGFHFSILVCALFCFLSAVYILVGFQIKCRK